MSPDPTDSSLSPTDPKSLPWYHAAFGELYPLLYGHRDDASARREAESLTRTLGLAPPVRLLDACCGAGRHAVAFARAGFEVFGADLSPRLLDEATRRRRLRGRLARADIRALPFAAASFDLVLNLFTSFGYFRDDDANRRALAELVRVLRPDGGRLVLDHMNRARVERELVAHDERRHGEFVVRQRRWIDKNRILKRIEAVDDAGHRAELVEDVRLYTPEELTQAFEAAGLTEVRLLGSFEGEPFSESSPRMIATGIRAKG